MAPEFTDAQDSGYRIAVNHRIGRALFGVIVGLAVAFLAYERISDPTPGQQRVAEEFAVRSARAELIAAVGLDELEIVDPLAPNRKVGKVYVYAEAPGWAVSGFYRRDEQDRWHPFLATMNSEFGLLELKVRDEALALGRPALNAVAAHRARRATAP